MKFMPPKERTIIEPGDGWQQQTYYIAEVAMRASNPVHRVIFYSGYLNGGKSNSIEPGNYNGVMSVSGSDHDEYTIRKLHYFRAIHMIGADESHGGIMPATECNIEGPEYLPGYQSDDEGGM